MSFYSLLLLAVGLCFDTFAVSLSGGVGQRFRAGTITKIVLVLAIAQTAMLLIGYLLGDLIYDYIKNIDHWIAFILLTLVGGKMILESFEKEKKSVVNFHSNSVLFIVALATSIDAIAVGISLAMENLSQTDLTIGSSMVFVITAVAAVVGLLSGNRLGKYIGRRAELVGGLILIGIGVEILLKHLEIL